MQEPAGTLWTHMPMTFYGIYSAWTSCVTLGGSHNAFLMHTPAVYKDTSLQRAPPEETTGSACFCPSSQVK